MILFIQTRTLHERLNQLDTTLAATAAQVASTTARIDQVVADSSNARVSLEDRLYAQEQEVEQLSSGISGFKKDVRKLSGSVETLTKLTTTDPELLQKYSKIYFLNENYKPADLTLIDEAYDLKNGKQVSVMTGIWPYLKNLLEHATDDGIPLTVLSGYRSFAEQQTLKTNYAMRYGTGANVFSADQGYSEHQLGTAIDFTTNDLAEDLSGFAHSEAFVWLNSNAYKFGFILSYPEGNAYYQYEPWHWRFVGTELASLLHKSGDHFYDLEQRDIDTYLPSLFDE